MGKRYKELLEDIFKNKILAEDFSFIPASPDGDRPSRLRPDGCDSWYVLSPCRISAAT
jgi:phytoene desaturase